MNICGGEVDRQVIADPTEAVPRNVKLSSIACAPCLKVTDTEEDRGEDSKSVNSIIDQSTSFQRSALDVIEGKTEKRDEQQSIRRHPRSESRDFLSLLSTGSVAESLPSVSTPVARSMGRPVPESPSPTLLNPLATTEWDSKYRIQSGRTKPNLLCPTLDINSTIEGLVNRLEDGVHAILHGQSSSGAERVTLWYDRLHHRICISQADTSRAKRMRSVWISLPVSLVSRIEVGKTKRPIHPMACFTVIADEKTGEGPLEFECFSPIERELIVSSLMIVLERAHRPLPMRRRTSPREDKRDVQAGGTCDQPIPCSPSLEAPPLPCTESLEQQIKDKRSKAYSTEGTTPATKDEEYATRDPPAYYDIAASESMATLSIDGDVDAILEQPDDVQLDFDRSRLQTGPWCSDDVCTSALNDMAETCTGIFALKQTQSNQVHGCDAISEEQLAMIEEYISTALGTPGAVYHFLSEGDVWNSDVLAGRALGSELGVEDQGRGRPQNRASLLNAQATRLRSLRNEMTFASALQQSRARMHFVQTTQSYDDIDRNGQKSLGLASKEVSDRFHASDLLKSVVDTMMHTKDQQTNMEVAYYDSDPEDSRPRTLHKGPRRITAERANEVASMKPRKVVKPRVRPSKRVSRRMDEETIVEIVQSMTNDRMTLMWHPTQNTKKLLPPICVKVWIESGVHLIDGSFLLPKLTWARASASRPTAESLHKLDLLDICRVRETDKVDRKLHPFADGRRGFTVETQSEVYMFQAQTVEERDRIVYGLKLVIARLASLLMLRDARAAEEFFGAISNGVPGEAPSWTK